MKTRLALLGSPVTLGLSPVLHRAAYAALGLDWEYGAVDCGPEELPGFLHGLDGSWRGFSVTMPLKSIVVPLLDEVSPAVEQTGAANTITVCDDGQLVGDNTDLYGMVRALRDAGVTAAETVTVLGAGATARTALAAARELGCRRVVALARNPGRVGPLMDTAERIGLSVDVRPWASPGDSLAAELVISAVPPGAADDFAPAWTGSGAAALLDVVYRPWLTRLAFAARVSGATVVGGLPMLVHQAALQIELQTGRTAPFNAMLNAAREQVIDVPGVRGSCVGAPVTEPPERAALGRP